MVNALEHPAAVANDAAAGRISKQDLAALLPAERRAEFLDRCARIEKAYTEACTAANDPCLESGCAAEGDICLQPLLRSIDEYHEACAAEWLKLVAL